MAKERGERERGGWGGNKRISEQINTVYRFAAVQFYRINHKVIKLVLKFYFS